MLWHVSPLDKELLNASLYCGNQLVSQYVFHNYYFFLALGSWGGEGYGKWLWEKDGSKFCLGPLATWLGAVIEDGSSGGAMGPRNGTWSSTLKVELIPISDGRSNTYALGPNLFTTLNGLVLRACNFLEIPYGNCSGLTRTIT